MVSPNDGEYQREMSTDLIISKTTIYVYIHTRMVQHWMISEYMIPLSGLKFKAKIPEFESWSSGIRWIGRLNSGFIVGPQGCSGRTLVPFPC